MASTQRSQEQLAGGRWDPVGPSGEALTPVPTPETKQPALSSVYALSKYDQERMCLMVGRAYAIPTVALRFFNVYGTRQALGNPYTGVLAIFASRLLNGKPPVIFEDGLQQRDFVSVKDVARACRLALEVPDASGRAFNIGSGQPRTVLDVARTLARVMGRDDVEAEVSGKYRVGDVRHCFADIRLARRLLGYQPQVDWEAGLAELAGWLERQQQPEDRVGTMRDELEKRGLAI